MLITTQVNNSAAGIASHKPGTPIKWGRMTKVGTRNNMPPTGHRQWKSLLFQYSGCRVIVPIKDYTV